MLLLLHSLFGKNTIDKIFIINAPIVSVVIVEMLWVPKDVKVQIHANMMACFTDIG